MTMRLCGPDCEFCWKQREILSWSAKTTNGQQAVEQAKKLRPRVVLLDLAMPLLNGLEATWDITDQVPFTKVLVLSAYRDDQHVRNAVQAGATGYLVKQTVADDLLRAVREIAKGDAFFSPSICGRLLTQWRTFLNGEPVDADANSLTSRQAEVLQLIAEGYITKQIAAMLSLSVKTVEKHRGSLMDKLDIHNIAKLTLLVTFSGAIELGALPQIAA